MCVCVCVDTEVYTTSIVELTTQRKMSDTVLNLGDQHKIGKRLRADKCRLAMETNDICVLTNEYYRVKYVSVDLCLQLLRIFMDSGCDDIGIFTFIFERFIETNRKENYGSRGYLLHHYIKAYCTTSCNRNFVTFLLDYLGCSRDRDEKKIIEMIVSITTTERARWIITSIGNFTYANEDHVRNRIGLIGLFLRHLSTARFDSLHNIKLDLTTIMRASKCDLSNHILLLDEWWDVLQLVKFNRKMSGDVRLPIEIIRSVKACLY